MEDHEQKDIILSWVWRGNLKTQTEFKTWKAKSWIGRSLSRLGNGVAKNETFQNLGCQVLNNKYNFRNVVAAKAWKQILLCSCLGRPMDQVMKGQTNNTIVNHIWKTWEVKPIETSKPWTFEEFTCIMLVIMFVSARLERPSLEVYLRFTTVPNPNNFQTCKMTKSEFHFQLPHLIFIIKNNIIILKLKAKRSQ